MAPSEETSAGTPPPRRARAVSGGRWDGPRPRLDDPGGVGRRQRLAAEPRRQAAAWAELQSEERQSLVRAELVDLHDAGMADGRDRLGLGEEAQPLLGAGV